MFSFSYFEYYFLDVISDSGIISDIAKSTKISKEFRFLDNNTIIDRVSRSEFKC